jgi:hypothetical protein
MKRMLPYYRVLISIHNYNHIILLMPAPGIRKIKDIKRSEIET